MRLVAEASEYRLNLSDLCPYKQIGSCSRSNLSGLENQMEKMEPMASERKKYTRELNNLFFCKQSSDKTQLSLTCVARTYQNSFSEQDFVLIGLIGSLIMASCEVDL